MEVLLVGFPGARFRWLHDQLLTLATRALVTRALATRALVTADASETLEAPPALAFRAAHHLDEAWADALRAGSARGIILLDEPEAAFAELRQQGSSPVEALRILVATATTFGAVAGCESVLLLDTAGWQDVGIGPRILDHCGWNLPEAHLPPWLDGFTASQPPQHQLSLDPQEAALLEPVLHPALHHAATGLRQPVIWPRACLRWGDQPEEPAPRVIDLTGWSRILAFGPYLPLPPGDWMMRTVLAFSPAAQQARLTLDLRGQALIGRCRFTVERPGLFAVMMPVTIQSPHEALELQLALEHGVIEGCLGIDHVAFVPQDAHNVA